MRITRTFLSLTGLFFAIGVAAAMAQEPADIAAEPAPTPAATQNSGYPDIESLREPGSSAKLFPAQPAATPDPTQVAGRGQGQRGRGGALGRARNSGRRRDVAVDQADADPLQVRVAFRRAKTVVMTRDPGLADLLQQATAAGTDREKRAFLKQYYVRLYAEVAKLDASPEMKKHLTTLSQVATARYDPKRREVGDDESIVLGRGGGRRGGGRNR